VQVFEPRGKELGHPRYGVKGLGTAHPERGPGDCEGMNAPIAATSSALADIIHPTTHFSAVYRELRAIDRCDSCPAAARAEFAFANGAIQWCGHHARVHMDKLLVTAITGWVEPDELWAYPALQAQMEGLASQNASPNKPKPRNLNSFV
jgi:hypothetical protein